MNNRILLPVLSCALALSIAVGYWGFAATPVPNTFVNGTVIDAAQMNANFRNLVDQVTAAAVPVGTVLPFAGTTPPTGFLPCDGQAVSRTVTFDALFTVIGTSWGVGDNVTTFNVPDLQGRFLRGFDNGAGVDPDAATRTAINGGASGDNVGSVQSGATALPTNSLTTASNGTHSHAVPSGFGAGPTTTLNIGLLTSTGPVQTLAAGIHSHVINGGDAETRPVNAAVNYIIKF